jgi:integrase
MNAQVPPAAAISGAPANNLADRLRALAARPHGLTVRELVDRYAAQYRGADGTRAARLAAWLAIIGDCPLDQVDSDLIHACRAELATQAALVYNGQDWRGEKVFRKKAGGKPKSPATLNRYLAAISAVFSWGVEHRLVPRGWANPCRGVRLLPEAKGRVRFLDDAERARLFDACRASRYPRLYALMLMAMLTGARRGELLALRWRQVDLEAGIAHLSNTKNGDRRTLVLLPQLVDALRPFAGDPNRLVFGSVRSRYQQPASVATAWRHATDRAKLRDFHFHDLRHCCASYMAQAGVPLNIVAEVLGHRGLEMTRRYAHLTTQTKAAAMQRALGAIGS